MLETKTDTSTLHAVFVNDTKEIQKAVKEGAATVRDALNCAVRSEAEFQKRQDDFSMCK